jgi:deazaflavin-dependent oxidoreductase (nitroreductase family)
MTPFQERLGRTTVQWMTGLNNVVYRLSNGRVAGHVPSGAPLCLLTTTGRKTGRQRTVPLLYIAWGDEMVLVASRGGMSNHPAWYLNLQDEPRAVVEVGATRLDVVARPATADEREEMWPALTAAYPHFDAYQERTARAIPVVVLSPHC